MLRNTCIGKVMMTIDACSTGENIFQTDNASHIPTEQYTMMLQETIRRLHFPSLQWLSCMKSSLSPYLTLLTLSHFHTQSFKHFPKTEDD